jgi:hypothetical protein
MPATQRGKKSEKKRIFLSLCMKKMQVLVDGWQGQFSNRKKAWASSKVFSLIYGIRVLKRMKG